MKARNWPLVLLYVAAAFALGLGASQLWLTPEPEVITETVTETVVEEVEVIPVACTEAVDGASILRELLEDTQREYDDALAASTEGDGLDLEAFEVWLETAELVDIYAEAVYVALDDIESSCG